MRKDHTRCAYARAAMEFFDWLEAHGVTQACSDRARAAMTSGPILAAEKAGSNLGLLRFYRQPSRAAPYPGWVHTRFVYAVLVRRSGAGE